MAKELAEAGLSVTCLDQGRWVLPEEKPHADADWEWQRASRWATEVNVRGLSNDYPVDTDAEHTLMWNGIGGSTVVYTAVWPRFRPSDFRKGTEHGLAPDWPITYEDLAPFYDEVDRMVGVGGLDGDPAIPPRGAFVVPPPAHGPLGERAGRALDRLGWHRWPMPVAILGRDFDGRPACNNCSACQSGCPTGAMYDVSLHMIPKAIAAGAKVIPDARVEMIETDAAGRATGAVYVDRNTGLRHRQEADVVVVAGNGIGTPRLLLLSANARQPNGLANASDQVGRNLMHHTAAIIEGFVDEDLESHKGVINGTHICEEFAETDVTRGFVNGFTMHVVRHNGASYQALGGHTGRRPPWGAAHHDWFRRRFSRGFGVLVIGDDLPRAENRVTLSETVRDSSGLPAPHLAYGLHENDRRLVRYGIERAVELCKAADAFDIRVGDFVEADGRYRPPTWHQLGTARMGDDPASSVTTHWHQAWDVPNLYIVDGSSLPTGAAVNPTSTISALALRCARHLAADFARLRRVDRPVM
ncbi:MAG: GMC family oxidoreductase [Rhizobiales bacterium]|nr:GMC family oxidoreductase [Hyphomicrobiales bacterium]